MDDKKPERTSRTQYSSKVWEDFPEKLSFGHTSFSKKLSLRYGENPGYPAAFYQEAGAEGPNLAGIEILQEGTKGLSYINIGDMDLGQRLNRKLSLIFKDRHITVIIKHEMPSGVAMGASPLESFEKAWKCDPLSNFGSVDVFNFTVDEPLARLLVEGLRNIEVVFAPGYTAEALEVLRTRKVLRIVRMTSRIEYASIDNGLEFKRVAGGLLVQKRFDSRIVSPEFVDYVSVRKPTPEEVQAAIFNWTVACFTRSNSVIIGTSDKVHGIGSGQRSRIDSAEDAVKLSLRGYGPKGCVMASDAYMPFPDVVEFAGKNGLTGIIYPLGSIKDKEVIAKADELGLAMMVTRKPGEVDCERCFLHR